MQSTDAVKCILLETKGSSPRKAGSFMHVFRDGTISGSVGGGALEKICMEKALAMFDSGSEAASGAKSGMVEHFNLGEGRDGEAGLGMICGGEAVVGFEYVPDYSSSVSEIRKERALVFGAGHVGCEVVPLLEHVGFDVWVFDSRRDFLSEDRLSKAAKRILVDYSDISKCVSIGECDYVIILTHGHIHDRDVLLQAAKTPAAYIGCIGSRRKVEIVFNHLRENGISEKRISEIHSPIGFDLGADTPEEIAVSIAAEVIKERAEHRKETGVCGAWNESEL